ncbi:jg25712, partial [Pararge aegeria aegeria]
TKVRIVFDASCKSTSGRSLNDNLLIGQKLQPDIIQVQLKYRLHNIAFTADIKMMYRYVKIRDEDRDFQRILWRKSTDDPIQEYRLCTVTFGVASAPFLALRTLRQLALDEASSFPLVSQVLLDDVFVDDIVTGADTLEDALKLQRELIALCKAGTFELRKWISNNNHDHAVILSGLDDDKCTKRIMLSEISKIYDPLGFLSPITLLVKHLIQTLWISGVGWDEQPPKPICELWANILSEFSLFENISLPRHVLPSYREIQIYGFSDSSEKAYAGCVYLRVTDQSDNIHTFLVIAKTKVSSLKRISLPRLELCGAVLVSKLIEKPRGKWFHDNSNTSLREGSVVVLIDNTLPPLQWRLARVHQLHPGADGVTRVVTVRIGNTFTKRAVVKVCPLPID